MQGMAKAKNADRAVLTGEQAGTMSSDRHRKDLLSGEAFLAGFKPAEQTESLAPSFERKLRDLLAAGYRKPDLEITTNKNGRIVRITHARTGEVL